MDLKFLKTIYFVKINTKYSKQGFKKINNIFCFLKELRKYKQQQFLNVICHFDIYIIYIVFVYVCNEYKADVKH